jgi:hypothetical protein
MSRRLVLALGVGLVVAAVMAAVMEATSPPAAAASVVDLPPNPHVPSASGAGVERCVDVLLLGFRGSGDHPRGRTSQGHISQEPPIGWLPHDFSRPNFEHQRRHSGVSIAQDRLGITIGALYEALHHTVTKLGRTVGFWSVGVDDAPGFGYGELYRAPPVDVAHLGAYLDSIRLDSLTRQVGQIVGSLVLGTSSNPALCPHTDIVVAGFSQGAIIARAMVLNLQQQLRQLGRPVSPVTDVVLIGDPLFRRQEHRRHGVIHRSDHQVDGLLRIDLVALCDRNKATRLICSFTAQGQGNARTWFREVWKSLRRFVDMHPALLRTSTTHLERFGTRIHVLCDSGDVVCSPVRIISPLRWKSDFPELLRGRPGDTIHGSYHQRVPWQRVTDGLTAPMRWSWA